MRIVGLVLLFCLALGGRAEASFINYSTREINVKIVYYGSRVTTAATDNLVYIYGKTSPEAKGKMVKLVTDAGDATLFYDFLPLSLGEIRGFKVRFHLYTVVTEELYVSARALILKGVDGIVFIADADPANAQVNVENLEEMKGHLKGMGYDYDKVPIVFQVVGTSKKGAVSVAELSKTLGFGDRRVFEAVPTSGIGVFDTLKGVAKLVLMELKKGTDAAPAKPAGRALKKTRAKSAPAKQ